jgi:hypothetical protein
MTAFVGNLTALAQPVRGLYEMICPGAYATVECHNLHHLVRLRRSNNELGCRTGLASGEEENHFPYWVSNHDTSFVLPVGKGKGKTIPVRAWTGRKGSRSLRLPDFITIGT